MKIYWSKKNIVSFFVGFLCMFIFYPPYSLNYILFIHDVLLILKVAVIFLLIIYMISKKFLFLKYDFFCIGLIILMIITAIFNPNNFMSTMKGLAKVFFTLYYLRIILNSSEICRGSFVGISSYFFLICVINFIQVIFMNNENNRFFLGNDNQGMEIYFIAFFLGYIYKFFLNKKNIYMLILLFMIVTLTFVRQIGASFIWIMGVGIYFLAFFLGKKIDRWILDVKKFMIVYGCAFFFCLTVSLSSDAVREFINDFLFEKVNSMQTRLNLWNYFLLKISKSPFWGYGITGELELATKDSWTFWTSSGLVHNNILETIYCYGIIFFVLLMSFIISSANNCYKKEKKMAFLNAFLILFLLHGFMENGMSYVYLYIPFLYFADGIKDNMAVERFST